MAIDSKAAQHADAPKGVRPAAPPTDVQRADALKDVHPADAPKDVQPSDALKDVQPADAPDGGRCVTADVARGVSPAAALFHSLADETRLRIVRRLAQGEARVVDLTAQLGLAQSTVSKHLACLRDCGLVDYRAEGRQSFYSLTRPELMDLLTSAEHLLTATGHTVSLRP